MNTPFLILGQLKELDLGMSDKPDYFNVKATVAFARKENCLYTACPNQDCNKKVTEVGTSEYHCEKCNQTFPNFKYRMILTVSAVCMLWEITCDSCSFNTFTLYRISYTTEEA